MSRIGRRATASGITALLLAFCGPAPGWAAAAPAPVPPQTWQPPPVDMSLVAPEGIPAPPEKYLKKYGCLAYDTSGAVLTEVPPAQRMLDIADAQKISTGKGVTVAVIDTGVNKQSFLAGRLTGGGDYVDPSATNNGTVDCDGHGTITAGIVAADTRGTGVGFTGVAPDADILAIRQSSTAYLTSGETPTGAGNTASLAQAIRHAVDAGARVITTSVDECVPVTDPAQPIQLSPADRELQATVHYAAQHDVVVVNSAGNINSGKCQQTPQNADPDPNLVHQIQVPAVFSDDVLSVASVAPATGSRVVVLGVGAVGQRRRARRGHRVHRPGSWRVRPGQPLRRTRREQAQRHRGHQLRRALRRRASPRCCAPSTRPCPPARSCTASRPPRNTLSAPGGRDNQVGYGVIDPVAALTASIPGQNGVPKPATTARKAPAPDPVRPNALPVRLAVIGAGVAAGAAGGRVLTRARREVRKGR